MPLLRLPPPRIDASDYDIILIDTPTRVEIRRGSNSKVICIVHDLLPLTDLKLSDVATRLFLSRLATSLNQAIEAMRQDLENKLTDLDDNVTRERQRAGDSDIGRLAFPSFLRSIEARRENLRTTMKDIEREYAAAQGELTEAFQELKSLEIAAEQQERRLAEIQDRRAQTRMDEIALLRHLRKHAIRTATR